MDYPDGLPIWVVALEVDDIAQAISASNLLVILAACIP